MNPAGPPARYSPSTAASPPAEALASRARRGRGRSDLHPGPRRRRGRRGLRQPVFDNLPADPCPGPGAELTRRSTITALLEITALLSSRSVTGYRLARPDPAIRPFTAVCVRTF